jgi:crossover junction endodeoxyribonuclease RuvC
VRVLGLDPSLTSFGAAVVSSEGGAPGLYRWVPAAKLGTGHERLDFLLRNVESVTAGIDMAVIEDVLTNGPGAQGHIDLGGLHWLLRHRLWHLGVPYAVVRAPSRMKYITGSGRADKDVCLLAAVRRFPMAQIEGNDQADALTLAAMGADHLGFPLASVPAVQREALTAMVTKKVAGKTVVRPAIRWPEIPGGSVAVSA